MGSPNASWVHQIFKPERRQDATAADDRQASPVSARVARRLRHVAQLAGGFGAAIGVVVWVGWWLHAKRLTSFGRGWPSMSAGTAMLAVLTGGSLLLQAGTRERRALRAVGKVAAAVACVLAALTLLGYLMGSSLGVQQFLANTLAIEIEGWSGRPKASTAAAFLLTAAALLLLDRHGARGQLIVQILAVISGAIGLFAFFGYAARAFAMRPANAMAFHTACALVVLNLGIVAACPDSGPMAIITSERAGGIASRRLMIPSLLLYFVVALLVLLGRYLGFYDPPVASVLLVLTTLFQGMCFILVVATRLNSEDARRRAAQADVQESAGRYRELVRLAPDGIFIADLDGQFTEVNDAACRLLGSDRKDIVGRAIRDIVPPEELGRLWATRERLIRGESVVSDWELLARDGRHLPVEGSASILHDGRWLAFVRDISPRKRQEAELERARQTDKELRAELEQVTRAAVTVSEAVANLPGPDVSAVLTTLALQAQALTGAKYAAAGIGTDPEKPFEPWVSIGMPPQVARALGRSPRPVGVLGEVAREGRVIRVPDVRRYAAFGGLPPGHPELSSFLGVPLRFAGQLFGNLYLANKQGAAEFSAEDERKVEMLATRAAVAVQTARLYAGEAAGRAWLGTTIDQIPEGIVLVDRDGRIVAMNRAAMAFRSGEVPDVDPAGNPRVFDLCSPDGSPLSVDEYPLVRALRRGESTLGRELLVRNAVARLVPVLSNAAPVHDERGEIAGAANLVQDITTMKELERLRQEWSSAVAHDLRQPVGSISLQAQMLLKTIGGEVPEKARQSLERIKRSTARLERMVDDLLNASLIDAKHLPVERQAIDLASLVDEEVEELRSTVTDHRIDFLTEGEQSAWLDPDRIRQVLENLVSNAAKYALPHTPIRVGSVAHDGLLEVTVTNCGGGISPEELPTVFDRFRRAPRARAERVPGLGLGLFIAKGIVEAHGGRIWAESVPGDVTSFHFTLPRARPA